MPAWLKNILTGDDNETYEISSVLGFAVVVVFLLLEIAAFCTGKPFDANGFGVGAGLAIGAMGTAIKLSKSSEPK